MRKKQENIRNTFTILIGEPHGNTQFGEAVGRIADIIKWCFVVVGYEVVGLIILIQDKVGEMVMRFDHDSTVGILKDWELLDHLNRP
jgi:hypothetical protein